MKLADAKREFSRQLLNSGNDCIKGVGSEVYGTEQHLVVYVDRGDYTTIPQNFDEYPVRLQFVGEIVPTKE